MNSFTKHALRTDKQREVVDKYPLVFKEGSEIYTKYHKGTDEDSINLRYGFEHEDGWLPLIERIAKTATDLVTDLRKNGHPDAYIHACISKEKFGTLRWQGGCHLPEPYGTLWATYVIDVESLSSQKCEATGEYGERCMNEGGWVKTLCKEERAKRGFKTPDEEEDELHNQK